MGQHTHTLSRRKAGTVIVTTVASALFPEAAEAQRKGTDITPVLADKKFGEIKDQLGKSFDAKKILGGSPYVLAYGFASCPLCNTNITLTIAEVQKAMREAGLDVPIVVVTLKPEEDGKDNASALSYQQRYESKGVKAFNLKTGEKVPILSTSAGPNELEAFQKKRSLHILFPKNNQTSIDMHYAMGATRLASNENSHTVMLSLIGADGKVKKSVMGNQPKPEERVKAAQKLTQVAKQEMQKVLVRA
jgi:cytochrome oxidase Cu insertion factor (SCO1/SenC/PrrC family)